MSSVAHPADHWSAAARTPVLRRGATSGTADSAAGVRTTGPATPGIHGSDAAFFDLDNTIVRGASVFHLARGLYRRGCFTVPDLVGFAARQARFRVRGSERADEIASTTSRALEFVRGLRQDDVIAAGEQIYDEVLAHKLWAGSVELANQHLAAGHRVWLVTAAPVELAELIARRLGLDGGLGTVAEVLDGTYTGHLLGAPLHGSAKAAAVQALAADEGLDLGRSAAYSDSANDLPLLESVGHPCAVNPDRRLAGRARDAGWAVADFRASRRLLRAGRTTALSGVGGAGGAGGPGTATGQALGADAALGLRTAHPHN